MKRLTVWWLVVALVVLVSVPSVAAAPVKQTTPTDFLAALVGILDYLKNVAVVFGSLAGFASLISVLIDIGKRFGVVKDGQAPTYNFILNGVAFVVTLALGLFAKITPEQLDGLAATVATLMLMVLGFITQIRTSASTHAALSKAGVPLIQKSYSQQYGLAYHQ